MGKIIDRIGKRYERLTVVGFYGKKGDCAHWVCVCDCGSERIVSGRHLASGHTKSCGCYNRDEAGKRATTHGQARVGKTTREFSTWQGMRRRGLSHERQIA